MATFRTKKTEEEYAKKIAEGMFNDGCILCKLEPIKEFKYWKIVKNNFPYDEITEVHDMILPKRHSSEKEINEEEKIELEEIKDTYINDNYVFIFESVKKSKSVPAHFHLHLIVPHSKFGK